MNSRLRTPFCPKTRCVLISRAQRIGRSGLGRELIAGKPAPCTLTVDHMGHPSLLIEDMLVVGLWSSWAKVRAVGKSPDFSTASEPVAVRPSSTNPQLPLRLLEYDLVFGEADRSFEQLCADSVRREAPRPSRRARRVSRALEPA